MQQLALAAHVHLELRRRLKEEDPELDEGTLADTVEGLTNLHEMLAAIVRAALEDEALAEGLKGRLRDMQHRLWRLEERATIRRRLVRDTMLETEIKKIVDSEFTISMRQGAPALVVVDEAIIPAQFWEPREPRLNRQGLLAELKQGSAIAGVQLSNPEPVLSVRSK
jgi:hypothetical protein